MRRALGRYCRQAFLDCSQAPAPSACSTSGRSATGALHSGVRWLASERSSESKDSLIREALRYDFYDPNRDVFREFQQKWREREAAASSTTSARSTQPSAAAAADWPPGYGAVLRAHLAEELPGLGPEEVGALVEAARRGQVPASRATLVTRFKQLQDLEPRFPGFRSREAVLGEPRLLRHSAAKLFRAMLVFQDQWPSHPVGPLMAALGEHIARDPAGLARRLFALDRALREELGLSLGPWLAGGRLTHGSGSAFLACSPYELEARVGAVAAVFEREGGAALLAADMGAALGQAPERLDAGVQLLRKVFALPHPDPAADRAYVTRLAVAWPGLLALPARLPADRIAGALGRVRRRLQAERDAEWRDVHAAWEGAVAEWRRAGSKGPAPVLPEKDKERYAVRRGDVLAAVEARPELLRAELEAEGAGRGEEGVEEEGRELEGRGAERSLAAA